MSMGPGQDRLELLAAIFHMDMVPPFWVPYVGSHNPWNGSQAPQFTQFFIGYPLLKLHGFA